MGRHILDTAGKSRGGLGRLWLTARRKGALGRHPVSRSLHRRKPIRSGQRRKQYLRIETGVEA